jgi:hypothetical protein
MAKKTPSDAALERVRAICMGFPAAEEKLSHGAPSFHVRGTMFLSFVDNHHADGRLAVWLKATLEEQRRLVAEDADQFFVPPYVGVKGWVGVNLDRPSTDWVGLAILVEHGWTSVAPASVRSGKWVPKAPPPPPPVRMKTDEKVAREALARVTKIALALPEAEQEREGQHATFRVRKKVFAYFLDNHHGDGIIAACVKMDKREAAALVKKEPKRFTRPAYMGAHGWVGVRLDEGRVDWKDVAARIAASHAAAAPKSARSPKVTRPGRASAPRPPRAGRTASR